MTTVSSMPIGINDNWGQVAAELGKRVPMHTNGSVPGEAGAPSQSRLGNDPMGMQALESPRPSNTTGATVRVFWWGFHVELDHETLEYVLSAADTATAFVGSLGGSIPSPVQPWIAVIAKFAAGTHTLLRAVDQGCGIYLSMSWFAPGVFVPTPVPGAGRSATDATDADIAGDTDGQQLRNLAVRGDLVHEPLDFMVGPLDLDVDTGLYIQPGQRVVISATGTVWGGVIFTGSNGPQGWVGWSASADAPLPYAAPFCLLARLNGRYAVVGAGKEFLYNERPSKLFLRVNDDNPRTGADAFRVYVEVYAS